ncbi:MAG TPA: DNA translocase FtsK [Candidatus Cottocaccamicrobium excrementipullorum]|nr:DNA translocase FtsK [Candidatus Cottocaccamicrobium excrementipullorum]
MDKIQGGRRFVAQGNRKQKTAGSSRSRAAGRKAGKQSKKQETFQEEVPAFLRAEVLIILAFAAAVLLFLSNFHLCGVVGDFLRSLQLGLFGAVGYCAPILLFVGISFYLSNTGNRKAAVKLAAAVVGGVVICGLAQLIFGEGLKEGQSVLGYYQASSLNGRGGGLIGGLLSGALVSVVGTIGTYLILFAVLIICGVCITERSVVKAVKTGSGKAYQYAREDVERRRKERQEERRVSREENVVRGVDFHATNITGFLHKEEEDSLEDLTRHLSGKGKKGQPFEAELLKEEELLNQEEEQRRMEQSPEGEAEKSQKENRDDVFSGSIDLPPEYEEPVPFTEDEPGQPAVFVRSSAKKAEPIHPDREIKTMEEMDAAFGEMGDGKKEEEDNYQPEGLEPAAEPAPESFAQDTIFVAEEPKRVVTATGKIIETETELLQKKIEKKRKDAAEGDSREAVEAQVQEKKQEPEKEYVFPPVSLLKKGSRSGGSFSDKEYRETAVKLQQTLRNFGVGVTVTNISCGPTVTRYELHPEQGVKVSKIVGLADDIKLSLAAAEIRIEAPIPGKSAVGIEVPNKENSIVYLRDLLEADSFKNSKSKLTFAVGKDIGGQPVMADIAKMPHLLIAGATGSGKSVCINTLIMSIIYKAKPDEVKLIMVDPKVVELSVYNGIPHLLIPVVTDPKKASGALNWAVAEMGDRYKKFAAYNVRDLKGYNEKIEHMTDIPEEERPKKLPQIVIIVDELADLMMVVPGEVEDAICRLAQLARAAGIHLVIATQRPSVNVITGLIKANVPSRIAFSVSSGVDSRTIIDMNGAEKLLGKGDMLFYPSGYPKPQRVQGAFVSDEEVSKVVEFLTEQGMTAEYSQEVESRMEANASEDAQGGDSNRDEYFVQAGRLIIEKEKASIGMLQRAFKIGFNRAARIMDQLAQAGVVGPEEGTKPRKILMTIEEFDQMLSGPKE